VPGGESERAFRKRAVEAVDAIADRHPGELVVAVTHGGVLASFACQVLGLPIFDGPVPFEIGIAFDQQCFLASFAEERVALPTFLAKHPRLRTHLPDLHSWCIDINNLKADGTVSKGRRFLREEVHTAAEASQVRAAMASDYLQEMRRLARTYR